MNSPVWVCHLSYFYKTDKFIKGLLTAYKVLGSVLGAGVYAGHSLVGDTASKQVDENILVKCKVQWKEITDTRGMALEGGQGKPL